MVQINYPLSFKKSSIILGILYLVGDCGLWCVGLNIYGSLFSSSTFQVTRIKFRFSSLESSTLLSLRHPPSPCYIPFLNFPFWVCTRKKRLSNTFELKPTTFFELTHIKKKKCFLRNLKQSNSVHQPCLSLVCIDDQAEERVYPYIETRLACMWS